MMSGKDLTRPTCAAHLRPHCAVSNSLPGTAGGFSMISDAVTSAPHRPGRISGLAIPLLAFALWSGCIGAAAHAAEPGKDAPAGGLPRILVLATGGTIAGQADARATGAYKSGQITGEQLM